MWPNILDPPGPTPIRIAKCLDNQSSIHLAATLRTSQCQDRTQIVPSPLEAQWQACLALVIAHHMQQDYLTHARFSHAVFIQERYWPICNPIVTRLQHLHNVKPEPYYTWQSPVEIEGYSVACFDRIAVFEVPYRWTSIKGGAHTCLVDVWIFNESTKCIWAPPLTEVQRCSASKAAMRSKYAME